MKIFVGLLEAKGDEEVDEDVDERDVEDVEDPRFLSVVGLRLLGGQGGRRGGSAGGGGQSKVSTLPHFKSTYYTE